MRVLFSFIGFHDPYPPGDESDKPIGPVLTAVEHLGVDRVVLLASANVKERTEQTLEEIQSRHPSVVGEMHMLVLPNPTDYSAIITQVREVFHEVNKEVESPEYIVATASGTAQMHACWLLLTQSGEIPAQVVQTHPPKFLKLGESPVKFINIGSAEFPRIQPGFAVGEDEELSIEAACRSIGIIGEHPIFVRALDEVANLASYNENILILGETGSGKEVFQKLITKMSDRSSQKVVTVNCAGLNAELIDSQLFGHRKGSFTGAVKDALGYFDKADGGILFLDEIGEIPIGLQAKLLRAIEYGEVQPVGGDTHHTVDVMFVAATNRDLSEMIQDGDFRQDLYQRFSSKITIPALRARRTDISLLAIHFLDQWSRNHARGKQFSPEALQALCQYAWPGNVRELQSLVKQSAMGCRSREIIEEADLRFDQTATPTPYLPTVQEGFNLEAYLTEQRRQIVEDAMSQVNGVKLRAAQLLGMSPQALGQYLSRQAESAEK